MLKVVVWLPAGIVMLLSGLPEPSTGWAAEGVLLDRLTVMLPGVAGICRVTVPRANTEPVTAAG